MNLRLYFVIIFYIGRGKGIKVRSKKDLFEIFLFGYEVGLEYVSAREK